jgi:penicillin-binding protein 1C
MAFSGLKRLPLYFTAAIVAAAVALLRFYPYPQLDQFLERPVSTEYLDRYGELLYVEPLEDGLRRIYRPLEELPGSLVSVFLAAEDRRFYLHPGVDLPAVLRSTWLNLLEGRTVSGASTVTMQLARIISPPDRGGRLSAKLSEAVNSLRLEARLSKEEILYLWLNSIPFGYRCEGVSAAAWTFFDRPLEELEPESFALLAVIPRRPERYNPYLHPREAVQAASRIKPLRREPYAPEELEARAALARPGSWPNHAPHFINYLKTLDKTRDETVVPESSRSTPWRITTSLDRELSLELQQQIDDTLNQYTANRLGNGAALVADNRTGEILAWIGSRNFWDEEHRGQIDGVLVKNQPGSTLKPFLYALALENGFLPNTILPDLPLDLGSEEVYQPMNFDRRFNGPVRLRVALASSLNVPAVYMINRLGVDSFAAYLIDLGFDSLISQRSFLGSGIALGNAELTLFELLQGYTLFSRGTEPVMLTPWRRNREEPSASPGAASARYAVEAVRDILGDNRSRVPGFGSESVMDLPFPSLFKTGTANQFQNIWAIGAVPEYTVGVWIGNFTGETVIGTTGSSIPASIAARVLTLLHRPGSSYSPPAGSKRQSICALSGMAAGDNCPAGVLEYLPQDHELSPCTWHHPGESGRVEVRYPERYQVWASRREAGQVEYGGSAEAVIHIPRRGAVFFFDPSLPPEHQALRVEAAGLGPPPYGLSAFLDGRAVYYQESDLPLFYLPLSGRGRWNIEVTGSSGESATSSFTVR